MSDGLPSPQRSRYGSLNGIEALLVDDQDPPMLYAGTFLNGVFKERSRR